MATKLMTISFTVEATDIEKLDNIYDEVTKTHSLKIYNSDGTTTAKTVIPVMTNAVLGIAFEV